VTARPIQLTSAAFLMLKAIANMDAQAGLPLGAADIVSAAELNEAEYAAVNDRDGRIELYATLAGVKYIKMIDALLAVRADSIVESEIPEQYRWDSSDEDVPAERRGMGP
jgi:hypothetical protein